MDELTKAIEYTKIKREEIEKEMGKILGEGKWNRFAKWGVIGVLVFIAYLIFKKK